jgi:hypothetical protein
MTCVERVTRCALAFIVALVARPAFAQQIATVSVPSGVSFNVVDVSASTSGAPNPVTISYSNPLLFTTNQRLKVSVQAVSSTFAGRGTTHIAASAVSWTATAASGNPSNGTLAAGSYTQVYLSPNGLLVTSTGSVSLQWTLGPIAAAGLRSGTHSLTIRWKFEAL